MYVRTLQGGEKCSSAHFRIALVKRGHRLRLIVAPMGQLVATTLVQKNYNSGGMVSHESAQDAKPVTGRLFHAAMHASILQLPLGRKSDATADRSQC